VRLNDLVGYFLRNVLLCSSAIAQHTLHFFPFGIYTNLFGLESPQQCAACENVVGWTRIWFRYTLEALSHWMFVVYFGGWREMLRHDARQSSFVECKGHIFLLNRARLSCPPGCVVDSTPYATFFSRWGLYWIITLEFYALSIKRHSKDGRLLRGVWNSTSWRGGRIDLIIQKRGEEHYVLCVCCGKPKIVFVDQIDSELLRRVGLETFWWLRLGRFAPTRELYLAVCGLFHSLAVWRHTIIYIHTHVRTLGGAKI